MKEDKKEFLSLDAEGGKVLDQARVVYWNNVAPGAIQLLVNTDSSVVQSLLDQMHRALPEWVAQGLKQKVWQGFGQGTGPVNDPAEGPVCGQADGELDAYQKASLVYLLDVFRSILMDDYCEQEICHALVNITKVKDVNSFLNQVQQLYVRHFRNYPARLDLFLKKTVLCAFIGLVPNKVSKQRPEELEGAQAGEPGRVKDKPAPRKGTGFSPGNIRRKLVDCLPQACHG